MLKIFPYHYTKIKMAYRNIATISCLANDKRFEGLEVNVLFIVIFDQTNITINNDNITGNTLFVLKSGTVADYSL